MTSTMNPALRALGYGPAERVVIFHLDDLGSAQATLPAFQELMAVGLLSSASIMMPCAWSPAAAQLARAHPDWDVGVHFTLTSEWDACRWRPLTHAPELVDEEGFFHRRVEEARQASAESVLPELRAQLETALRWGVNVSHVDAHMGTAADPRYLPGVVQLALQHRVVPMIPRFSVAAWQQTGMSEPQAQQAAAFVQELEERGLPLVDHLHMLPLHEAGDHAQVTLQMLRDLPPGLTHFILHPAQDSPELRAMCADAPARAANYQAFLDPKLRKEVLNLGVQVISYRPLRDLLPRQA